MFNVPFAPPTCPRCSSRSTDENDERIEFLCGTELVYDDRDDAWEHDWSQDANEVCQHIAMLRDQIAQLEQAQEPMEETMKQAHKALAFSASAIRCGEPWTPMCDEVIGGALTALRPMV